MQINDSVVLVTGGAGNLGRAVTREFLERGARVAVPLYKTDVAGSLDDVRERYERDRFFTFALDLTTERGAAEAIREVMEWAGRLDAVAHLVGGYVGGHRLADTVVEAWDLMMDLNLKSAWLVSRFAIPAMVTRGGGTLVFVSSEAARQRRSGHAAYAIAKAGLLTLVDAIREEYGEEGIRAAAVMPDVIDTEANRAALSANDPSRRWSTPEEVAQRIVSLVAGELEAPDGAIPV